MNMKRILTDTKGLTLIELMIVMVLSLILMGAVYMAYQTQHVSGQVQHQTSALQNELRVALDIMQMDIANAGCDRCATDNNTIQGIGTASSGTFISLSMNYDTCVSPSLYSPYTAQYTLSGGGVWRSDSDGHTSEIIQNVTTFGLSYYDQDGNQIATSPYDDACYVVIDIAVESPDIDTTTGNRITRSLRRIVAVRNANL